jgi:predicted MPP superfamily phosphohydrolase
VTDIHWGRILRMGLARRIIGRVRQARPDILVSTGDLIDSPHPEVSALLATLGEVATPLGKFAVIGNHEVYSGTSESERMLQEAGFEVLRGKGAEPVPGLWIWGVDDPAVGHRDGGNGFVDESSLPELPQDQGFLVLLKHQPTVTAEAASRCDLQLSGHTHKGQIFPFGLLVRLIYPYPHGRLVELSERLNLYVSPGAGTWGPPFRFLARPEVTVFELVREPLMTRPTP